MEPYKGKCQGGNPFALANQGCIFSILTPRKGTNNLIFLSFHSQDDYSPSDKMENKGLSSACLPSGHCFLIGKLTKNYFARLWKRAWCDPPIPKWNVANHVAT